MVKKNQKSGLPDLLSGVAKKFLNPKESKAMRDVIYDALDVKKLSKNVADVVVGRVVKQKDALIQAFAKEFSRFLNHLNVTEEAQKILDGLKVDIQASISFEKKSKKTFKGTKKIRIKKK